MWKYSYLLAAFVGVVCSVQAQTLQLWHSPEGQVELGSEGDLVSAKTLLIEQSDDLRSWRPFAQVLGNLEPYAVRRSPRSYFRSRMRERAVVDDWSNQLDLRDEDLMVAVPSGISFAKFTLPLVEGAERVFFQDTNTYPFHYQFVVGRLPGYEQLTLAEFDEVALRRAKQELVLGSVLLPRDASLQEAAIQFSGNEVFTVDEISRWYPQVCSRLAPLDGSWRFFYMPSFEQREVAFANVPLFSERGIEVDSPTRWVSEHRCYAEGWAFGTLVFVPGDEIDAAYGDGRLTNADILLTDGVPAEIPVVAGVLSLEPATPNSHVALLAQSFRLPFAFASGAGFQDHLKALVGRDILLVVTREAGGECQIEVTDTTGRLMPSERQAISDLKKAPAPDIRPKRTTGAFVVDVSEMTPSQIDQVGGKAANFGFLRRAIPEHAPSPAWALTFDLWDAFLSQSLNGGSALEERIAERLDGVTYPPDLSKLRPALTEIRTWFEVKARFTESQRSEILRGLEAFSPNQKIRFRSSTNVEDSESFSGAGLYDSFSGCLADALDDDVIGPSHCDSTKADERGVFRAIKKVYASFYNENAYVERLRHGLDEAEVGMAVLVHHSFPDAEEEANGVASMEITYSEEAERLIEIEVVTQLGAVSVTNPDGSQQPEVVRVADMLTLRQASSLLEGDQRHVLTWPDDYEALVELLDRAALAYEAFHGDQKNRVLDFEYKKMKDVGLVVKQIRALPQPLVIPPPEIPN